MDFELGSRIRSLRKSLNMSIAELSEKSGVSTGMISQIERDKVMPSIMNLYYIARALGTDINYFFNDDDEPDMKLIRRGDHKIISGGNLAKFELLIPGHVEHSIDVVKITIKGGESSNYECITHEGEECGYVLSGILTVRVKDKDYTLYPGDSIFFKSTLPHNYYNLTDEDCVSIWAMTPNFF